MISSMEQDALFDIYTHIHKELKVSRTVPLYLQLSRQLIERLTDPLQDPLPPSRTRQVHLSIRMSEPSERSRRDKDR